MPASREDLGAEGNEARRRFWEMCASRQPRTLFNEEGDCLWSEEPGDIAVWADKMLAEWDKRWIADEPSVIEPPAPALRFKRCACGHSPEEHRSGGLCEACPWNTGDSTGMTSSCQMYREAGS